MAYVETITAITGSSMLNMGATASGNIKTKAVSIGKLNPNAWDVDKFAAIANALAPFFDRTVYELRSVKTYQVHE